MATTSPPNNIPIARPAMSPEVYLVWDRASTSFPHQLSIASRLINHTNLHACKRHQLWGFVGIIVHC